MSDEIEWSFVRLVRCAQIAQSVEHFTRNEKVESSILSLGSSANWCCANHERLNVARAVQDPPTPAWAQLIVTVADCGMAVLLPPLVVPPLSVSCMAMVVVPVVPDGMKVRVPVAPRLG